MRLHNWLCYILICSHHHIITITMDTAARALLSMRQKKNPPSVKPIRRTTGDKKLDSCVGIKTAIGVIEDARHVLEDIKGVYNDESATAKRKREANQHIDLLGSMFGRTAVTWKDACKNLNPLPDYSVDRALKR